MDARRPRLPQDAAQRDKRPFLLLTFLLGVAKEKYEENAGLFSFYSTGKNDLLKRILP